MLRLKAINSPSPKKKEDLNEDEKRAHILEGLKVAIDNIDRIVEIIKKSKNDEDAKTKFNEEFGLDDEQGEAILSMQLRRLTGLSRDKIAEELKQLYIEIKDLKDILANHSRVVDIVKNELTEIKNKFGDKRRTQIIDATADVADEDLIPVDDVIISLSTSGYIKRLPFTTYKLQNRGGRGVKGMTLNEDDVVDQSITLSTHDQLLMFTNKGKVYRIKGFNIPEASRNAKGIPVINIINIDKDEKVKAMVPINKELESKGFFFFVTKKGLCKRVPACEFDSIRQNGKIAISLKEEDELVAVRPTMGQSQIIIAAANGKAVRFDERGVREMGRNASGVKGMAADDTEVIGMCTDQEGEMILVVTEKGFGKQTPINEYRETSRGAKGVKTININKKNGKLVALKAVKGDEDCLIMTSDGIVIRIHLAKVTTMGRATQGVKLMKPQEGTFVSAVSIMPHEEEGK